jgi:DNA-directed RNA polymerase subunit omega
MPVSDRCRTGSSCAQRGAVHSTRPAGVAGLASEDEMIHPPVDKLLKEVPSKYALVIIAAKRARQINSYHHQLGEGTFDDYAPPLVESRSKNYLTMALEEVAQGKIQWEVRP